MRHAPVVPTILVLFVACGGGGGGGSTTSPSIPPATPAPAPAPTPPPVFEVVDGINRRTLTPESVVPADPQVGQSVTVSLTGYLTREQPWDGSPIALWPCRNDEELFSIQELVYAGRERPLSRWVDRTVEAHLQVVGEEWADAVPGIQGELEESFAELASLGAPTFSWASASVGLEVPGGPGLQVVVTNRDECFQDEYVACARWWREGHRITRARLVFDSPHMARDEKVRRYLLGHVIGLSNLALARAAMNRSYWERDDSFHELERRAIRMVYVHRNPGNQPPDRDPGFAVSSSGVGVEGIGDPGPRR